MAPVPAVIPFGTVGNMAQLVLPAIDEWQERKINLKKKTDIAAVNSRFFYTFAHRKRINHKVKEQYGWLFWHNF